ncbi:MAG: hypothetical protein SGPRY_004365 [Prymnesium sp.]
MKRSGGGMHQPAPPPCPCAPLCATPTSSPPSELFGFGAGGWPLFDWSRITTLAWPGDAGVDLVCHAHRHGARVISGAPAPLFSPDALRREGWIHALLDSVRSRWLDGVTFDYEEPMEKSSARMAQYAALVNETTRALHAAIPGSQVSVCVPWSPDAIDGRDYDFLALAEASDLLYVMAYDTRSQIYGRCIASANSPLSIALRGLTRYIQLGIPAQKLILGTPWYGYAYPCLNDAPDDAEICRIPLSPFFNYKADGKLHQMWYDNAYSSQLKYAAAKRLGVRGVGPFTWGDLDNNGSITGNPRAKAEAKAMWAALDAFKR